MLPMVSGYRRYTGNYYAQYSQSLFSVLTIMQGNTVVDAIASRHNFENIIIIIPLSILVEYVYAMPCMHGPPLTKKVRCSSRPCILDEMLGASSQGVGYSTITFSKKQLQWLYPAVQRILSHINTSRVCAALHPPLFELLSSSSSCYSHCNLRLLRFWWSRAISYSIFNLVLENSNFTESEKNVVA